MRSNFFGDGITSEDPSSEIRLACELGVLSGDDLGEGERPPATGACVRGNDGVWGYVGGFNKKTAHRGFVAVWWARNETKAEVVLGGLAEPHISIEKC